MKVIWMRRNVIKDTYFVSATGKATDTESGKEKFDAPQPEEQADIKTMYGEGATGVQDLLEWQLQGF